MTEDSLLLPNGRRFGYAIYGPTAGWPVVYFHGTPSSRLELLQLAHYGIDVEQQLLETGLCLIAVDRPGMGLSGFNPDSNFLSCAADVMALLRYLEINQCSTLCWSGGGPYALALAWQYPQVVKDVQILCGFSRQFDKEVISSMYGNKLYFRAAKHAPRMLKWIMNRLRQKDLRHLPPRPLTTLPPVDYNLLKHPARFKAMTEWSFKEACRQGAAGAVHEAALYFNEFGFELSAIGQPVHYWWGSEDTMVIRHHAEAIAEQMPNATVHYREGEGHLSVFVRCFAEALQAIASAKMIRQ